MNFFHWISIALLTLLIVAGFLSMTKEEAKSRPGIITLVFYILFLTSIIGSALWH